MPKHQMTWLVAVAAVGGMLLAGCTEEGAPDVASLGETATPGTTATDSAAAGEVAGPEGGTASAADGAASAGGDSQPDPTQRERADELYACLVAADIPVKILNMREGQALISIDADHAAGITSNGMTWMGTAVNEEDFAELDRIREQAKPIATEGSIYSDGIAGEPEVIVNGLDVTEAFDGCVTSSGYTHPEVSPPDPAEQLRYRQRVAEAGNIWAACAREHGFPGIEDVTATSDANYRPTVLLPVTITAEQVESLVEACPTFDPDAEIEYRDLMASGELTADESAELSNHPARPDIGFDAPGWNGDMEAEEQIDVTEGENARLSDLQEILLRPYSDWATENLEDFG